MVKTSAQPYKHSL